MNSPALFNVWIQVIGILALEVALVAGAVTWLARLKASAPWQRAWYQAAVVAVLVVAAAEFSGLARSLARWATASTGDKPAERVPASPAGAEAYPVVDQAFRARVEKRLASRRLLRSPSPAPTGMPAQAVPSTAPEEVPPAALAAMPAPAGSSEPETARDSIAVLWLGLIWAIGAGLVLGRTGATHSLLLWFRWRRRTVHDQCLQELVLCLSETIGLRRPVRLVESARLSTPIAFGLLRPAIGLPLDFASRFDRPRQEAMLAHELAHLAGRDPLWCLLADLAAAGFWWHPAAWWLRRQLQLACEMAADEASLVVENGPHVLAECLVELGGRLSKPLVSGPMNVSGFRSALGRRVQQLIRLEHRHWSPPNRVRTTLLPAAGATVLAAVVVLCTAWATPQALTKGDSMKTMQLNWKRSLAALALLATVQTPTASPAADAPIPASPPALAPQPAEPPVVPTPPILPVPPSVPGVPPAPGRRTLPTPPSVPPAVPSADVRTLQRRYGIIVPDAVPRPAESPRQQKIEAKLQAVVLPELALESLPLAEVVKILSDQCRKLDPEKEGVNFLLNPVADTQPQGVVPLDPATGIPQTASMPTEQVDIDGIPIKFNIPLRHVTVRDALNAIVLVAQPTLESRVEDYGVVISLKGKPAGAVQRPAEPLVVRTYKVDTNTLVGGMESAFGIKRDAVQAGTNAVGNGLQAALKALLTQIGITLTPGKSVFYNELTGVIMVRGTVDDQELAAAAVETLGGSVTRDGGFGVQVLR